MGFFDELKTLAKDIGNIVKEDYETAKSDPKKYALESLRDVGEAAGKVAAFTGKAIIESGKDMVEKREAAKELDDKQLLKNFEHGSMTNQAAALAELKERGHDTEGLMQAKAISKAMK